MSIPRPSRSSLIGGGGTEKLFKRCRYLCFFEVSPIRELRLEGLSTQENGSMRGACGLSPPSLGGSLRAIERLLRCPLRAIDAGSPVWSCAGSEGESLA